MVTMSGRFRSDKSNIEEVPREPGKPEKFLFNELSEAAQEKALNQFISFVGITTDTGDGRHGDCLTREDVLKDLLAQHDKTGGDWLYFADGTLITSDKEYP